MHHSTWSAIADHQGLRVERVVRRSPPSGEIAPSVQLRGPSTTRSAPEATVWHLVMLHSVPPLCSRCPGTEAIGGQASGHRLRRLGIEPHAARRGALSHSGQHMPPAALARVLDLAPNAAVRWGGTTGGGWNRCAAELLRKGDREA